MNEGVIQYRIGIDVGQNGVGLAAIAFEAGNPSEVLAMVTHRHDAGLDPAAAKQGYSRKKTSGVARRTRRLRRNRARRLKKLDEILTSLGLEVPAHEVPQTWEAWEARAELQEFPIDNEQELHEKLVLAVRHMARHRGWKNPWWSWNTLWEAPTPTSNMNEIRDNARKVFADLPPTATIGQIGFVAAATNRLLRPRKDTTKAKTKRPTPVLNAKVMQEDQLAELRSYWDKQNLPDEWLEKIAKAVFYQTRPKVKPELVGHDDLPGMTKLPRASRSSLEFQEFRIRAAIANLKVKVPGSRQENFLSVGDKNRIVDLLMGWDDDEAPTWADVAEELNISVRDLKRPEFDDSPLRVAPYDRSSNAIRNKLVSLRKDGKEALEWWDTADRDQRSLFATWLGDQSQHDDAFLETSGLSDIIASWSEGVMEKIDSLSLEPGRAAYSIESLKILNRHLAEGDNLHEARKHGFNVDDSWTPSLPRFEDRTGQPVVDRVIRIVHRFINGCVYKWGVPESIVIEHVRSGLLGPEALLDYKRETTRHRNEREQIARDLKDQGISERPSSGDITRMRIVQEQQGVCLYCGTAINIHCELDHIVPRAGGGSNFRENLAAVCRECNRLKGKTPFARWARETSQEGVSLEGALDRVKNFSVNGSTADLRNLKRRVSQRLRQTDEDQPIDERSMASTAYAALEVRDRVREFTSRFTDTDIPVEVYRGSITSAARKAGHIDKLILLRDKDIKDRGDFRHHAIDAAVMTVINRSNSQVFAIREAMRSAHAMTGSEPNWKDFRGNSPRQEEKFIEFETRAAHLARIIRERIDADRIPVISPLRLKPETGKVHADTIVPFDYKALESEWTDKDIVRVVDNELYLALVDALGGKKVLPTDKISVIDQDLAKDHRQVALYGTPSPQIPVRGGSAAISDSLHHFRVYAWKDKKGAIQFGQQRVFGAEFRAMWGDPRQVDVFTAPVPRWAFAHREMPPKVKAAIEAGNAKQIGWYTRNDEIELDLSELMAQSNVLGEFLRELPEKSWRIRGSHSLSRLSLSPLYLSSEGTDLSEQSRPVQDAVSKGIPVSASSILDSESMIIRRGPLGIPKWNGGNATSYSFRQVAEEVLGTD